MDSEYGADAQQDGRYEHLAQEAELLTDGAFIDRAIAIVKSAKTEVDICAYTWRWYENAPEKLIQKFNYEVMQARNRGVRVRALLHYRTDALRLRDYGIDTKMLPTKQTMHTKAIMVDQRVMILGSHNLTDRGAAENLEASLCVTECNAVTLFAEYFARMWQNYAVK